jgi:SAM-dependent methyltransferase
MRTRAGTGSTVTFEIGSAQSFEGGSFDLVTCFDALHDMGDPVGAARRIRAALAPDGVWMIVEPYAADRLEENLTPIGRMSFAASTMTCVPGALAQDGGTALGAQAGEARLREIVVEQGGFGSLRRAAATPLNLVLEARVA